MFSIRLVSSNGEIFYTNEAIVKQFGTIKSMIEAVGEVDVIPISNVRSEILGKLLEWGEQHKDVNVPFNKYVITEWDNRFFRLEQSTLFELMLAANYVDAKLLLEVACSKVAMMLKNKTPAQIRRTLNLTDRGC